MKNSTLDKIIEKFFTIEIENKSINIYMKGELFNLFNLGSFFCKCEEHQQVINIFKKTLKIDKKNIDIMVTLSDAYAYLNNFKKSISFCKKALKLDPSKRELWELLGDTYNEAKEYKKAIKAYKKAIKLGLKTVHIWYKLGSSYEEKGDLDLSYRSYLRALWLKPRDPIILFTLRRINNKKIELLKRKRQKKW